ncbi:MAG: isoleucine--tRNA ligase, partial [Candidatus Omnitrophota bacterium]|nr:isoleucine--tRNA ligase [Candidatus Omnitrophota bacterium]
TRSPGHQVTSEYFVIWTTTPWTLLANVAIAVHPDEEYAFIESSESGVGSREVYIIAKKLAESAMNKIGIKEYKITKTIKGKELEGLEAKHPFIDRGSKVVLAGYVSMEDGTGCVHTAPGHGQEDYITGKRYKLHTLMPVDSGGKFDNTCGEFSGQHVIKANKGIVEKLKGLDRLLHEEEVTHSYPHCWRCKKPIIFRATDQYFLKIDHNDLRKNMLKTISSSVKWIPEAGESRISAMVANRPDWCLSRQRYWGVPIIAFYCKKCKEVLLDAGVIDHVAKIVESEGADAWFIKKEEDLMPAGTKCGKCGCGDFKKETDIIDVWFDSGVSHQAVLKKREMLDYPCELYLEGSDQHRGWFQSALIIAMGIDGKAPYKQVLTHGFVVDGMGKKMSKSLGNVITPEEVMKKYGADILRLWVASSDYSEDVRMSGEILTRLADAYRKIRNTYKYLLSNLYDFDPEKDKVAYKDMPEFDRWMLHRLALLIKETTVNYEAYAFHKVYRDVYNFCVTEVSSIYLDVMKDKMYTFAKRSIERRSGQTVMFEALEALLKLMAPLLAATADEAWGYINAKKKSESVHLESWPNYTIYKNWIDESLDKKWKRLISMREEVLKSLEEKRSTGGIGSGLEASVTIATDDPELKKILNEKKDFLRYLFIVSNVELKDGESAVLIEKAPGSKCSRCWNYSPKVGSHKDHPALCERCVKNI